MPDRIVRGGGDSTEVVAYRVRDWQKNFENHESRKVKNLAWVPVKNKHDGAGYRRVAALPNSVQVFCGWCLIIQVASRMPTRGVLRDDDGALDPADLASKTGFPETVFKAAFEALIHPKIRWLEPDEPGQSPGNKADSGRFRDAPGDSGVEGKGTEQKDKLSTARENVSDNPPTEDDVLNYAKGNSAGVLRTDICLAWMNDRESNGWRQRSNGHLYEFTDWRSDLLKFHRIFLENERDKASRKHATTTNKPAHTGGLNTPGRYGRA